MSNYDHPYRTKASKPWAVPWVLFLFLAAVFFFTYHDISASKSFGGYDPPTEDFVAAIAQGQLGRRIALLSLGVVAIVNLVRSPAKRRLSMQGPLGWLLLGFCAWALLSTLWAEDVSQSFKRVTEFVILCVAAVWVVRRLSLREIILWTFFSTAAFLLIGVVAQAVNGTFQPLSAGYRFAGTLPPNNEGIGCALLVLSAITLADVMKRWRTLFWGCGFIGFVFLVLSGSRTGLAAALAAVVIYLAAVRSRSTKVAMGLSATMAALFLVFVIAAGLMPGLKNAVLLGRDDPGTIGTFTGRTDIWKDVSPFIRQSPVMGYGYGAFWTPAHITAISDEEQWGVGNSHSAYIDFLLMLGAIGLLGFIAILTVGVFYAFDSFRFSQRPAFAFCGVVLVFCAMDGLFESDITEGSQLMFVSAIILIRLAFVPLKRIVRSGSNSSSSAKEELLAHA